MEECADVAAALTLFKYLVHRSKRKLSESEEACYMQP